MNAAEIAELEQAIDTNDIDRVKMMLTRNPALHSAPLGYGNDGPLTWVAECRVPWESPRPERLEIAAWMIEHGSDVHQGGDAPLMRAALNEYRIPMMDLLVSHGADVNALWHGHLPHHFCALRVAGSCRSQVAHQPRRRIPTAATTNTQSAVIRIQERLSITS